MQAHFFKKDVFPLLKLAIPLIITGSLQSSVFFFQTLFLARLGEESLAAGALVSWLFATLVVLLFGILSSINVLISHEYGAKNHTVIAKIIRDGILLAIMLAIPAFILFWNLSPVLLLLGQDPTLIPIAQSYLHALAWGLLANFITIALFEFVIGLGHTQVMLFFNLLSIALSIFWSYGLIFGAFGLPALGIAGSGWGLTISNWITCVCMGTYLLRHKNYNIYFQHIFRLEKTRFIKELIRIGLPMGTMFCMEVGFFFVLSLFMGYLGSEYLAANQITLQYMTALVGGFIFSIAQAVTVRMGHLLGAQEIHAARRVNMVGLWFSGVVMCIVAIGYLFFPDFLIGLDLDTKNPKNFVLVNLIKEFLIVCVFFQFFEALRISLFGALRALKDTKFTLITSVIAYWLIALPSGYALATLLKFGGVGLWWGMTLGAVCGAAILYWRFRVVFPRFIQNA